MVAISFSKVTDKSLSQLLWLISSSCLNTFHSSSLGEQALRSQLFLLHLFVGPSTLFSGCLYSLLLLRLSHFSSDRLFVTVWTVARQAPLSMGFSRQEYWSGLPRPPPADLPDPGIKPPSLTSRALAGGFFTTIITPKLTYLVLWFPILPTC